MKQKIVVLFLLLLLAAGPASASWPREGAYEKTGGTPARMVVLAEDGAFWIHGSLTRFQLYAPLIGLEAFDKRGGCVQQMATLYSEKTPSAGAGENWLELTGQELEKARSGSGPFSLCLYGTGHPRDGREQIDIFFYDDGMAEVYGAGDFLSGTYRYAGPAAAKIPLLLPLFVWTISRPAPFDRDIFSVRRIREGEQPDIWHFRIERKGETPVDLIADWNRPDV